MRGGEKCKRFWKYIWSIKDVLIIFLTPLCLLPLPLVIKTEAAKCGYVVILMGVFWTTEVLPLAATSLFPVILFPLMGVMPAKEVSQIYMKDIVMMFIGGMLVAIAIEHSELHKRIALRVLTLVGEQPKWLMLGFMAPTWFLAMWICNAATTAMMIPMVEAVIKQLQQSRKIKEIQEIVKEHETEFTTSAVEGSKKILVNGSVEKPFIKESKVSITEEDDAKFNELCKGMTLCVAFAANVGGTATLTGSGTNFVFKGAIDTIYREHGVKSPVTFASWLPMCLPPSLIMVVLIWMWLQIVFFGFSGSIFCCCRKSSPNSQISDRAIPALLKEEYLKLGSMKFQEAIVLFFFVLTVLLLFFREPGFMPGWSVIFKEHYTSDASPILFIGILLFICPATAPGIGCCWKRRGSFQPTIEENKLPPTKLKGRRTLIGWKVVHNKMPWNVMLILGGGMALAAGVSKSGLAAWIGDKLTVFRHLPDWLMVMILCVIVAFVTEFTSNATTATILMPIMAQLALSMGKNPLYLMWPVAISTSFAFMLPAANPPNAIVFSYGRLRVSDMARGGWLLNFICVAVLVLAVHTYWQAFFDFNNIPWKKDIDVNSTTVLPMTTM